MKKKSFFAFIFILISVLMITGCNKEEASKKKKGSESDGPVRISVFSQQDASRNLETNSFTKFVEKEFNIKFDWQVTTYDATVAAEARNISLASGDYPDLFLLIPWVDQFSQTDLLRYGKQGVVLPLNDLIRDHAPNIQRLLDEHMYYKAMSTAPDGNIYGLPQLIECYHCSYPNKYWMNTAWLEKLGLEQPRTVDDLREVLLAFKNKDPNGNGKADEVPLSGTPERFHDIPLPYLMNGFIYDDAISRLILDNGKVDFVANKEGWKEGLKYIQTLYKEGLIDPGSFTQNAEALQKLGNNADGEILGSGTVMHPGIFVSEPEYQKDYDPVAPLEGPNGSFAVYNYPSSPGGTFVLTNKASEEVQIAAIKMLDYMFTPEGSTRAHFGEEGKSWKRPEEGDKAIEEGVEPFLKTIPGVEGEEPRNDSWGAAAQYFHPKEYRDSWVQVEDIYSSEGYERRLQEATKLYDGKQPKEVFPHWTVWIEPELADEVAMMETNIKDYIEQNALQFITGAKDIDKEWDSYVKGYDQLNLPRYLEIMQKAYDNLDL
ncbi:ABC transporter substrate-binding protein [Lederbergia citrea]|uniref:ABC transporter substrate-binding protein n=1 Tax=Lederbergia citrea TaxID=2833581 RepID=A0A942Z439_9BACI|nr:ABC transporter substrate-binding protein [Lederbergia citrea]MBS4178228.1 ABC transporter substrate-binding protein [Lederbergia citrea]MBS4204905.1 ABC transporter substrate-binding protein [Lederbergia citrea]MBS4223244.1 ABC transporter substrate-binding protein [Lederbergia citrea]